MKHAVISLGIIIALATITTINSARIQRLIDGYIEEIEATDTDAEVFSLLYDNFLKDEKFISLTVSHEDLRDIEKSFSEIIAAARMNDTVEVQKAKSRLIDALLHLGRLCGINIDSIL